MLRFHSNERSFVDGHASSGLLTLRDAHVEVEGRVDLVLAVLDTRLLSRRFRSEAIAVNAVEVAPLEEKLWERGLHQSIALVFGVALPRATGLSHFLKPG